jgi:hypothetical protein
VWALTLYARKPATLGSVTNWPARLPLFESNGTTHVADLRDGRT